MTELLIVLIAVAAIAVVGVWTLVRSRPRRVPTPSRPVRSHDPGEAVVTLPVDDADPDSPATQRIVAEAAERALVADANVVRVVVVSRGGRELGRIERKQREAPRPFVDVPPALREPHARRHYGPGQPLERDDRASAAHVRFEEQKPEAHRSLVDHFDLPEGVKARITNPEDPVQIVRAILEEAHVPADVDDDFFRAGDQALIVLRTPFRTAVGSEELSAAFLRFQRSGAKRGIMLTVGTLYTHEIRRREALAPALLHAGPDGIQRMADAAAMGANPLDFVVETA